MKKWVDITRSRVGALNFRSALRSSEPPNTNSETPTSTPKETEDCLEGYEDIETAEAERKPRALNMNPDLKEFPPDKTDPSETVPSLTISAVLEMSGCFRETDVVKGEAARKSGYDPLGVANHNEVHQLRAQVAQLSQELEAAKKHGSEVEEKLNALQSVEAELSQSQETVQELEMQLAAVKEEFQRFRRQSESNIEDYEQRMESLSEQLQIQIKPGRHSHSKSLLESFPEQCDSAFMPQPPTLYIGTSVGGDTHSTDIECSVGQDSATTDELEESHRKIQHLTHSLRTMSSQQRDLQRRLVEAQDERDYLRSDMEDLQKQVDASCPETSANLRARIQELEADLTQLRQENASLTANRTLGEEDGLEPTGIVQTPLVTSLSQSLSKPERTAEEGPSDLSEELMDCSLEIMGEMAHATSNLEVGISMSYVQFAGLLAAIQKAIKHLESTKEAFNEPSESFRMLDKTLSKTLSISRYRVHGPEGEGEKRLDQLMILIREKETELKFMEKMITDLRLEIKGRQSLTLQHEVQLEYIKQQLSSSDKVISLTWEAENLKKLLEECQRELKSQRDLNDQQRQELMIQWQSKQQAVTENLSQNHRVTSFSQQLEHVVEANEALEAEKLELEETLEQARLETEGLKEQFNIKINELFQETAALKSEIKSRNESEKTMLSVNEGREILELLQKLLEGVEVAKEGAEAAMSQQRSLLLQSVTGLEIDCSAWKLAVSQQETEMESLKQHSAELQEKLTLVESMKTRAEQEKAGMQEILSLTSETTSAEILNLQNQLTELSNELDQEKAAVSTAEERITELQTQLLAAHGTLGENSSHIAKLEQQLESANKETMNLETRMQSYKDVISGLNRDISVNDEKLRDMSKISEQNASAYRMEKERADSIKEQLQESQHELQECLQEKSNLEERCSQLEALRESLDVLSSEKSEILSQQTQLRSDYEKLRGSYDQSLKSLEALKTEKEASIRQQGQLEEQLMEERQNLTEARLRWEAEISALTEHQTPRERWPQPIVSLVQSCESQVATEVAQAKEVEIEKLKSLMEACEKRERATEASCEEQVIICGEEVRTMGETIDQLQEEMKQRESILQQEIHDIRDQKGKRVAELEEELTESHALYTALQSETDQTIQHLKDQTEQKDIQLAEVQDKARELMKEKDSEIERLKKGAPTDISQSSTAEISAEAPVHTLVEKLQSDVQFLTQMVKDLTSSLEESENTHELRNKADQVLKDELSCIERSKRREGLDMDYVKNVLVYAFQQGTLPKSSPMFVVLARLFEFSPEEMERINSAVAPAETQRSGSFSKPSGSFFSAWMRP